MHSETQHYAAEALHYHRQSVYRAHRTVQLDAEATRQMSRLEQTEGTVWRHARDLEHTLAESNLQQQRFKEEANNAQHNYNVLSGELRDRTISSEEKDAEMKAQAAVVAAFRNESGAASREVIRLRTLLADCSAKYHEATQFEEAITRRPYNEEHFSRIEMQIAESAKAASEDWASRFGAAKHHHECQVALMSAEEIQLRAKLAKAPEHVAAEETSTSELRAMSDDVRTMLSAMEESA